MMDYPIVFIPGLFGSLGDDVIPGTGKFSFGLAEKVYRPFIKILNSMGYVEEKNLFISYYDWKQPVLQVVNKYLSPDIENIKEQTGSNKVIIIGHSLGGLLGRIYTTYYYPSNVDKLILVGTPNLGSVNAYRFWNGGKIPYSRIEDNILYNGLKLGFILYYKLFHDINYIDSLRKIFPVAKDLLPSYGYGNYLFVDEGIKREIPIVNMSVKNSLLNRLNENNIRQGNIYIISGTGYYTDQEYKVELKDRKGNKWKDGKPIETYRTNQGDGTVTTFSGLGNLGENHIILKGNHTDILYKSKDYISEILGRPILREVEIKAVEKVEIILAKDCHELEIITSDGKSMYSRPMDIKDNRINTIDLGGNNYWIMAVGEKDLDMKLNIGSSRKSRAKIYRKTIG